MSLDVDSKLQVVTEVQKRILGLAELRKAFISPTEREIFVLLLESVVAELKDSLESRASTRQQ